MHFAFTKCTNHKKGDILFYLPPGHEVIFKRVLPSRVTMGVRERYYSAIR